MNPQQMELLRQALNLSRRNNWQLVFMDKQTKTVRVINDLSNCALNELSDYRIIMPVNENLTKLSILLWGYEIPPKTILRHNIRHRVITPPVSL